MIVRYNTKDIVAKVTLILCFSEPVLYQFLILFSNSTPRVSIFLNSLMLISYGCRIITHRKIIVSKKQIIFWSFIVGLFIYTLIFFPQNGDIVYGLITKNIWHSILAYIIFFGDYDISQIKSAFKASSYLYMLLSPSMFLLVNNTTFFNTGAYMVFGYLMIIPAIFFLYFYEEEKKTRYLVLSIICVCLVMLKGNRGAILCYLGYICLNFLIMGFSYKKLFLISLLLMVALNLDKITGLLNISSKFSRNLSLFTSGKFSSTESRQPAYMAVWDAIKENKVMGLGIGGDRMVISGGESLTAYAHNFILEILVSFGVFIGIGMLFGIVYCTFSIFKSHSELKGIMLVFFSLCFFKLMLSSSFWTDTNLYILIALYGLDRMWEKKKRYHAKEILYWRLNKNV